MSADTLVLDPAGRPVGFLTWQDAVTLAYKDRAVVVSEDAQVILHSPSFEMGMPRVVRLKNHISKKLRLKVPLNRRNIAVRDNSQCQYCGVLLHLDEYQIEHVVPRAQGGITEWRNLVLACGSCNSKKRDRTPEEANLRLRRKPYEPTQFDARFDFKLPIKVMRPEWRDYSNWLYWNLVLDE